MKFWVGVTDGDWYRFLKERDAAEMNFWQPSGKPPFKAIKEGAPFLFKLHAPDNFIVGGAYFHRYERVSYQAAWDCFGEANGASSLQEMRLKIEKYRRIKESSREDYQIGCILLLEPFFFERSQWIPIPEDFKLNIVRGKTYDSKIGSGRDLWKEVESRLCRSEIRETSVAYDVDHKNKTLGMPRIIRPRLGQGTFRWAILNAYENRCATTGEKAVPALEAAHIVPVAEGGEHRVDNGLLLRADVHRLFDRGYVTVNGDYQFLVSSRLKDNFNDGDSYLRFHEKQIRLPLSEKLHPKPEFLDWHHSEIFRL